MSCQISFAQVFNFSNSGQENANEIMFNYIQEKIQAPIHDVIAYFYDIDNDNEEEIIGIVKNKHFYSLAGYNLVILKKQDDDYQNIQTDIYFDDTKPLEIDNKKITYYKSVFYKHKKYSAKYNNNNEVTSDIVIKDFFTDKKVKAISEITKPQNNLNINIVSVNDLYPDIQRNVNIKYGNLSQRTKHYLDMK